MGIRIVILCLAVSRMCAGPNEDFLLRACVLQGVCEKVQLWLDASADPNHLVNSDDGDTLLHAAAWDRRYLALVAVSLSAKQLHDAVKRGSLKAIRAYSNSFAFCGIGNYGQ